MKKLSKWKKEYTWVADTKKRIDAGEEKVRIGRGSTPASYPIYYGDDPYQRSLEL